MASTKERLTEPLIKRQKFSIEEPNSIIMIKEVFDFSLTSVLSSSDSMRRR